MGAKEFRCPGSSSQVPDGGYGIVFNKYTTQGKINYNIYIYADCSGNQRYEQGEEIETIYNESGMIYLEKEVKIKEVSLSGARPDKIEINFKPPDPEITFNGSSDPSDITITLTLKDDENKTKVIKLNIAGLIDID